MRRFFQVWYADGTVRSGISFDDWRDLPDEDVLVVVEAYDRIYKGRYACLRHAGRDYYWMTPDGEIGGHSAKYIPADATIKTGTLVDDATWERIYNAACVGPVV